MAKDVVFDLTGDKELMKLLKHAPQAVNRGMAMAMYEESTEAFGQSQDLVPVRYGVLRSSGYVTEPTLTDSMATIEIGYGGAAAPYAAYVHEVERYRHDPPTRSKFLSYPLEKRFPVLGHRLRVRLEGILREILEGRL